jgi:hypothetical protein
MNRKDKNQGEGNREAAKQYNEAQHAFVKQGHVEEKAKQARKEVESDPATYAAAEKAGKARAAEEDPQLDRDYRKAKE